MKKLYPLFSKEHLLPLLFLCGLCVLAWACHAYLVEWFQFDRIKVEQWEVWRLVTAHIFHTNTYHLILNIAGLILLWLLHGEKYTFLSLGSLFLFLSISISVGIYLYTPDIVKYVGLSGVLHGLFIWGACDDIRLGYKTGYAMVIGALAKIANEQLQGPNVELSKAINATVAVDAHLYGVIAGFIAYGFTYVVCYKVSSNNE